ncbi:3-keto-5-aminohexanoate cleavage protein [Faunimonas sp. B44]|uniref:3-keto-5-aminohexanoate cleavage protein n=1 Tax=Faunimonas sp. B44 TaxID=3461493 RepID=UPI004043BE17
MTTPAMICVAITGSVPRKKDTPAVPITPAEQIESTHQAFEAGATIVHVHVRGADESPSSDPDLFDAVQEGVRKQCPGMVVQFSTGGRGRTPEERKRPLALRPDMASYATGSVNFDSFVYENTPEFVEDLAAAMRTYGVKPEVEVFDVSMLYAAHRLAEKGAIARPIHVQFVLGIRNALPVRRRLLEFLVGELRELEPDATWAAAGIGRHQLDVNRWCLELGGHCRTGLEDNIRFDAERLAASNAELVARVADLIGAHGRHVASVGETRALLALPPA